MKLGSKLRLVYAGCARPSVPQRSLPCCWKNEPDLANGNSRKVALNPYQGLNEDPSGSPGLRLPSVDYQVSACAVTEEAHPLPSRLGYRV